MTEQMESPLVKEKAILLMMWMTEHLKDFEDATEDEIKTFLTFGKMTFEGFLLIFNMAIDGNKLLEDFKESMKKPISTKDTTKTFEDFMSKFEGIISASIKSTSRLGK